MVADRRVVKLVWPTTTSAGWPLPVGSVFQINTRLFCESATTSWLSLLMNTDTGADRPLAVVALSLPLKSDWPSTKSALAPLPDGMLL